MGLIINRSLRKLMKGYPVMAQSQRVAGGVLEADGVFGQLVKYGSARGFYLPVSSTNTISAATDVAGFLFATNIKSPSQWPAEDEIVTKSGEGFNLLIGGDLAVEVDSDIDLDDLVDGTPVYATSAGVITNVATSNIALNAVFMGINESVGSKKLAAIRLCCK